jgi:hypothetical protein
VKVLGELRNAAVSIEQNRVVMVALGDRQDDIDLEPQRRFGETVNEDLVGERIGTEQELALCAASRE